MNALAEINQAQNKLKATFERVSEIDSSEVQADLAKYLCILVSGFLETSIARCLLLYANRSGTHQLQRFVERTNRRFTNAKSEKILNLLGRFDPKWRIELESFLVDEKKDAVDSVIGLRNSISHGQSPGITYQRVKIYYTEIIKVVEKINNICGNI
jgi:hypothetical protein